MKLKHNPLRLHYDFNIKGKDKPLWYDAMHLNPPAPKPSFQVIPSQVGQFIGKYENTMSRYRNPKYRVKKRKEFPSYYFKSQEIEYPEDKLRQLFYDQHPYELIRSRIIVDDEDVHWDSIHGTPPQELSGERFAVFLTSVIQFTLYKSQNEGISVDKAYKSSLIAFYDARRVEEKRETAARELRIANCTAAKIKEMESVRNLESENKFLATGVKTDILDRLTKAEITSKNVLDLDPLLGLYWTKNFMDLEREEIQEGVAYKAELAASGLK